MKKLFIVIPSNRCQKLPKSTVTIIEKTKTPTIFVKQNLPPFYQNHPYIKEIISHQLGVSKARNLGIKTALKMGAKIIAFTDDDCIIRKNWVNKISQPFNNSKIDIVFGQTLPYQSQKHPHQYCPSTFSKVSSSPITSPVSIVQFVGTGNNFAASSKLIAKTGLFSTSLGPNTKIPGSEDIDFFIRVIKNNFPTYYEPQAVVYHNKWLFKKDLQALYQKYTFAITYIYYYHAFYTDIRYLKILFQTFIKDFSYYFIYLKQIVHLKSFIKLLTYHNLIIYNYFKATLYFLFNHNRIKVPQI